MSENLSTPKSEVKRLLNWLVSNGRLVGLIEGTDKEIRTSPIVSREGQVVTTKSGSRYLLVDPPHEYMQDPSLLKEYWSVDNPLDAVEQAIVKNAAPGE